VEDFETLVESVKKRGVQNAIVLHHGMFIDGRSQLRACIEAGVPIERVPRRELAPDDDPYQFVWDQNVARRHLTPAQRAAIRIKVMERSGELVRKKEELALASGCARWRSVPRDIGKLATFIRKRMTPEEVDALVAALTGRPEDGDAPLESATQPDDEGTEDVES
jgi:hypothetical protein